MGAGRYFINEPSHSATDSLSYDSGSQVSPTTDEVQKAHELALERYRRMQQQ